jgi:hypothetical protein
MEYKFCLMAATHSRFGGLYGPFRSREHAAEFLTMNIGGVVEDHDEEIMLIDEYIWTLKEFNPIVRADRQTIPKNPRFYCVVTLTRDGITRICGPIMGMPKAKMFLPPFGRHVSVRTDAGVSLPFIHAVNVNNTTWGILPLMSSIS